MPCSNARHPCIWRFSRSSIFSQNIIQFCVRFTAVCWTELPRATVSHTSLFHQGGHVCITMSQWASDQEACVCVVVFVCHQNSFEIQSRYTASCDGVCIMGNEERDLLSDATVPTRARESDLLHDSGFFKSLLRMSLPPSFFLYLWGGRQTLTLRPNGVAVESSSPTCSRHLLVTLVQFRGMPCGSRQHCSR